VNCSTAAEEGREQSSHDKSTNSMESKQDNGPDATSSHKALDPPRGENGDNGANGDDDDEESDDDEHQLDDRQHQPIAEFLYQLTKLLTDDNSEIIEWVDGKIKVHYPERLEGEVLHKYFRHSKFASFQRQLNYFSFRKIAGKGKVCWDDFCVE
jgi:HSF-type DNA-binding